jgi:lipopolysaccharide/colanic/teichoic acid biosynthesis glycosyltransferase
MFTDEEKKILSVRPGITDWASIWNNNEGEVLENSGYEDPEQAYMELIRPEKLRLQMKYVDESSLMTDLKIILETASTIVSTRA